MTYGDQKASLASHIARFVAACTFRHVHAAHCSHGGRSWWRKGEVVRGVVEVFGRENTVFMKEIAATRDRAAGSTSFVCHGKRRC